MKKQNHKTLAWSAAVLTLMLIGTACSGGNNDSASTSSPTTQASTPASPSASSSPSASASSSPSATASPEMKTATGEFQGLSDAHSIEITVDGKPESFQISPETADKISAWEAGTKVSFQYIEQELELDGGNKTKQKTITVIDKA